MNTVSGWEAETKELIDRVDQEMREIEADAERRTAALKQRKWALEEALRAYREMRGTELTQVASLLTPKDTEGKNQKEILRLIAQRNDGLLIVRHATRMMREADVFGNPDNADAVVYSILNRSKDFVKVGKGVYKLNGTPAKAPSLSSQRKRGSGLREEIKRMKDGNPQLTKTEIRDILVRGGFDFQGKKPGNAVNMAWVAEGYHQEVPTQKHLLELSA